MNNPLKVAYIEGRPSSHPAHAAYAHAINAVFHHVDFRLQYHDRPGSSAFRRYLSWFLSAITFPKRKEYDVFFSEEAYFMLGLMKKLGLISKKQKLVAIMGSHTLYFIYTNKYKKSTTKAFIRLFKLYDIFICEGPLQYQILSELLGENKKVKLFKIFNGSPSFRFEKLIKIIPNLNSFNIVTIGAIPNSNRIYYKGLDLMLSAFAKVKILYPKLTFTVVGEYDPNLVDKLLTELCDSFRHDIFFVGQVSDLGIPLKNAALYLHMARGEAWGISVTEAMTAGVPPIVSEWTGSKEAVLKVSNDLVVPLDVNFIVTKIAWYFGLSDEQKLELSSKCKKVAMFYTEENACENFKQTFYKACSETV